MGAQLSLEEIGSSGNPANEPPSIHPLEPIASNVGLWWCSLATTPSSLQRLESCLSDAERQRAARFGNPQLRSRYIAGRGALRTILGERLRVEPRLVDITRGMRGRPQLAGFTTLDFNVSHTLDVALVGLAEDVRIGVDVECIDRVINVDGIARKFMTAAERAHLGTLETDARRRRVLKLWTCKEAMSKATGDALSAPFSSIDIASDDRSTLSGGPAPYAPEHWTLVDAAVPAPFVATVALWRPR
jgi:4'-phosphopantetheinyl transferase